jgi:NADP-reducing hydrogenase subunit HndB
MLRDWLKGEIDVRSGPKEIQITVHMGTCGIAAGARDVLTVLANELTQASAENVTLKQAGCVGMCDKEPMLTLRDKSGQEFRYGKLDKNKIREIVNEHVVGGRPVVNYIIAQ